MSHLLGSIFSQKSGRVSFVRGALKVSGSKTCILVLYMDVILLATNDKGTMHEVKQFFSKKFDRKDMGGAFYVIGIKIHRDKSRGTLGLS